MGTYIYMENSVANWKTVLTSNQETLGTVDIKRGIFQGEKRNILPEIRISYVYEIVNFRPRS